MPAAPIRIDATLHPNGSVVVTLPADLVAAATSGSADRASGPVHAQRSRGGQGFFVAFGDEDFARAMDAAEWVSVRYERALRALADA